MTVDFISRVKIKHQQNALFEPKYYFIEPNAKCDINNKINIPDHEKIKLFFLIFFLNDHCPTKIPSRYVTDSTLETFIAKNLQNSE